MGVFPLHKTEAGRLLAVTAATLALVCGGVLIATLVWAPSDAAIDRGHALLIARQTQGGLSDASLQAMLARMPADAAALGGRYDPVLFKPAAPVAMSGPPDRDMVRLLPGLSPSQAQAVNAGFAFSEDANPAARPFRLMGASVQDRERAQDCLAQAVYYEAGFEPLEGAQAVAQVVLNRVRHPAFPKTVCGVVYEGSAQSTGCQFSFTCDGSLARPPQPAAWKRAQAVAERALNGFVLAEVGGATHYHTQWVAPYWAPTLAKVAQIGAHIFYRWPGDWGLPSAFRGHYAGGEVPGADVGGDPMTTLASGRIQADLVLAAPASAAPAPPEQKIEVASIAASVAAAPATPVEAVAPAAPVAVVAEPAGRPAFSSGLH